MCLAVGDGLLLCGGGLGELGTSDCRIGRGRRVARFCVVDAAEFGESRAQRVDVVVADEAVGGRRRPVAGTDQFPAPLIDDACCRDVIDLGGRQRTRQNLLGGIEFGLSVRRGCAGHHPRGQHTRQFDIGRRGGIHRPRAAGFQRDRLATDPQLDASDRNDLDVGRRQLGLPGGALHCGGGGLDVPHRRVGERYRREFPLGAFGLAECGVDLGQPAREPVGLVAVGEPLDGTTRGVDADLARLYRCACLFGGHLGGLLHLVGGELVFVCSSGCGFEFGDRRGAFLDVGLQPAPLGQRRDGGFKRGACRRGDHLGLLELLAQRGDLFGRRSRGGQSLGGFGTLAGKPLRGRR